MNCGEAGDVLAEYFYNDLAPERRAEVEDHSKGCSDCAAELRRMRAVTGWLDRTETPLPDALSPVPLLVRQAGELRRQARRWRRGAVAVTSVAAAALIAIAAIDHVRWENNELVVHFGPKISHAQVATVDENLKERVRRTESSINVLNASMSQLVDQQRQFVAQVQQAMQGTTQFAEGTGPASEAWLAEVGLGPDDY
jgi:hypothetical protein